MDVLSSTEFRKAYARLTKPTKVLVNGHVIGIWTPGGQLSYDDLPDVFDRVLNPSSDIRPFNSRPFTPVPKK